jgi:hypothetical protein
VREIACKFLGKETADFAEVANLGELEYVFPSEVRLGSTHWEQRFWNLPITEHEVEDPVLAYSAGCGGRHRPDIA